MIVTIRQTDSPSWSKRAGPCWIGIEGSAPVYAVTAVHTLETDAESVVLHGRVCLRRATRTTDDRESWTLRVTGDPADTVTLSLGSPQSVTAVVTGVALP